MKTKSKKNSGMKKEEVIRLLEKAHDDLASARCFFQDNEMSDEEEFIDTAQEMIDTVLEEMGIDR